MLLDGGAACLETPANGTPPPIESSERAREREIAAYLSAASFPPDIPSGPPETIAINADPTLNALVQLGALRLGTDRSFLSLIDRHYQYVVSEMTRSHSITEVKSDPNETMFLGCAKLDACWGVCPTTMKAFLDETGEWVRLGPNVIANRTRYIVNDFRTDPEYSERPYVKNYPFFVSYLEVPLVSPLGYILGSYCVVDNKLHDFDNDEVVGVMNEISDSIMAHLELMRIKQNRDRSERLVDGLSGFVRELPPAPAEYPSTYDGTNDATYSRGSVTSHSRVRGSGTDIVMADGAGPTSITSPISAQESIMSPFSTQRSSVETPPTSPRAEADNPMEQAATQNGEDANFPAQQNSAPPSVTQLQPSGFISSANIKSTFFRAATTIRQTMDIDGLMFIDAVPSAYSDRSDQLAPGDQGDPAREEVVGPFCAAIVRSAVDQHGDADSQSQLRLPEATLQRFIKRYPRGHVFSADEFGPIDEIYGTGKRFPGGANMDSDSTSRRNDSATLFRAVPSARYIVFLPMWHFQRECWYAAALGWVSDPTRALDGGDLGLVSAFGNSVMAEVSHLEALAVSRAKSHFVSSVSHELRSPLHGIMASSELLRESIPEGDGALVEALDMIDACGKTLLDTLSNLLDHAIAIGDGKATVTSTTELPMTDLAVLVEDVVEAVNLSYISENTFLTSMHRQGLNPMDVESTQPADQPILVTLNINTRPSWSFPLDNGTWKRIVMNVFGNALKYTNVGHVEVGLDVVQGPDASGTVSAHVCFSVEDTGCGMSSDYLKYRLFTPFSQENPHFPGTGLGLSIVQQLVGDLGGVVDVRSALGKGTVVRVLVPLSSMTSHPGTPVRSTHPEMEFKEDEYPELRGRTACFIAPEEYPALFGDTNYEITNDMRNRCGVLEKALKVNGVSLGMCVVSGSTGRPAPDADFYFIDGGVLDGWAGNGDRGRGDAPPPWEASVRPLIVLNASTASGLRPRNKAARGWCVDVQAPVGPRKLASVLCSVLQEARMARERPVCEPRARSPDDDEMQDSAPEAPAALHGEATQQEEATAQQSQSNRRPLESHSSSGTAATIIPAAKRSHLLLVDDNPINLKLLTAVVGKLHHTFSTARNGLEAVQRYKESIEQKRPFDLVFMDITMPVMDGFEATREIRKMEAEAGMAACRVVALTGLCSEASRREAVGSGCDLFLTKPVKLEKVRGLLDGAAVGVDG